jgi:hypothetical protein
MILVHFADAIVLGVQGKSDADQFRAELAERMRKFNLELHPEKTWTLEFGPFAINNRQRRGEGKPETFNFLVFTHISIRKRNNGMYTALRQTVRMHEPIPEVCKWLEAVVRGHNRYYKEPISTPVLKLFRFQVGWLWQRSLSRRSQHGRVPWCRMQRSLNRWVPMPTVCHPYPLRRMGVVT